MLQNGDQCICVEDIPIEKMRFVNDIDEPENCNVTCSGSDEFICGGIESVSIYVASNV